MSPRCSQPFLVDNEEMAIFWVGLSVNPSQIQDLFGVEDVGELDPRLVTPPPRLLHVLYTSVLIGFSLSGSASRAPHSLLCAGPQHHV